MLRLENVSVFYGEGQALFNVSLEISTNERVALLGRNGAGKSTILKTIMGLVPPKEGRIIFNGEDLTGKSPDIIALRGIGYIPEERRIFPRLTVLENLKVAAIATGDYEGIGEVLEYFPVLKKYLNTRAINLSGGEQKMLAIARGLIGKKKLLLLDEPTEGLAPTIVRDLWKIIKRITEERALLLVEQNTILALKLVDRAYILRDGRIIFEGSPEKILAEKSFREYLAV